MDEARHGQRLLMTLSSMGTGQDSSSDLTHGIAGFLATIAGFLCLGFVLAMCSCSKKYTLNFSYRDEKKDKEENYTASDGNIDMNNIVVPVEEDGADLRSKTPGEAYSMNGGHAPGSPLSNNENNRQTSTGSIPPGMRPTSLRELPEPPVSSRHKRNTSMSGVELPPVPPLNTYHEDGRGMSVEEGDQVTYAYPKHVVRKDGGGDGEHKIKSHSDGYDHLGQKAEANPIGYDSFSRENRDNNGQSTPVSEAAGVSSRSVKHHYSLVRERTYDVVKDVETKGARGASAVSRMYDPYSTVSDKDDHSEVVGELYKPTKDEDPYNHIGDSDGIVTNSFIRHVRQPSDVTDPYSTVQDGSSSGDMQQVAKGRAAVMGMSSPEREMHPSLPTDDHHHDYDDTEDEGEAVYAVVKKTRGESQRTEDTSGAGNNGYRSESHVTDDYSFYGVGPSPPEPPRLYNAYDEEESYSVTSPTGQKKEHKYSKVTARESLASMSARNALNPYEIVNDMTENTYATVEGGSGDGVVLRHVDSDTNESNRNSQTSDTYAEIGISGGGLSSSMMSNSSNRSGGNNNANMNASSNVASSSAGAPVPPSLDSLHLMTKSQTSSEGDRLSDRHLASPEDSGLDAAAAGLSPLHAWNERNFPQQFEKDSPPSDQAEDGYSKLKKFSGNTRGLDIAGKLPPSGKMSEIITVIDDESGEATQLSPDYTTVKDFMSNEDLRAELENDPNYESVDEARAKVNKLMTGRSVVENEAAVTYNASGDNNKKNISVVHVQAVKRSAVTSSQPSLPNSYGPEISSQNHAGGASKDNDCISRDIKHRPYEDIGPATKTSSGIVGARPGRRKPNHDYEELDLSPPTSPTHNPSPHIVPVSPTLSTGEITPESSSRLTSRPRSHMYEELAEVRANSSTLSENSRNDRTYNTPFSSSPQTVQLSSPSTFSPVKSLPKAPSSMLSSTMPEQSEVAAATSLNSYSASRLGNRSGISRFTGGSTSTQSTTPIHGSENAERPNSVEYKRNSSSSSSNGLPVSASRQSGPFTWTKKELEESSNNVDQDRVDKNGKAKPPESDFVGTRV